MEVILKADVSGLGEEGDIRNVTGGYARNFLLPKGLVLPKTEANMKWLARQQNAISTRKEEKAVAAKDLAEKVASMSVTVTGKVSSGNRLYGSIHAHEISIALKEAGITIDARKIEVGEPIRQLGDHTVTVKLYEGVQAKLKVHVTSIHGDEEEYVPYAAEAVTPVDDEAPVADEEAAPTENE